MISDVHNENILERRFAAMKNNKLIYRFGAVTCAVMLLATGCNFNLISEQNISDNSYLYLEDDEDSLVTMYLTVTKGAEGGPTDHTWSEVNANSVFYYQDLGIDRYQVEAILQVGDENGPVEGSLGYGVSMPNAVVQIRGNTTSESEQKSFKIELNDDAGEWRDQSTIALNKHPYDFTRMKNKLAYDIIKDIPDMISFRTQFVRLYVKDESSDAQNPQFVDYGLFTQVEQPNRRYLANHGLDKNGHFYKPGFFEFHRYEDEIKLIDDAGYDYASFERIIETKGNDDHTKLIGMLEELNDYDIPIETTFEKYFNSDNYFKWLAFQILTGNVDTLSRNYMLYSPEASIKWYFITWDADMIFYWFEKVYRNEVVFGVPMPEDKFGHEVGISNYWGIVLHERVLKVPEYRERLDQTINWMREKYLTEDKVKEWLAAYRPIVEDTLYAGVDREYLYLSQEEYDMLLDIIPTEIEKSYQFYKESLTKPMPFFVGVPESYDDGGLRFIWASAYSFDNLRITYKVEIAEDSGFASDCIVLEQDGLAYPNLFIHMLPDGRYFIRITATDENGNSQKAMAYCVDGNYLHRYGMIEFQIIDREVKVGD